MRKLLLYSKPTVEEVRELALLETDPGHYHHFEPIARGPIFAVIAIPVVVVLAIPSCLLRAWRAWRRGAAEK